MIEKKKNAGKDNRRKIRRLNKRRKRSELQGIIKINKVIKTRIVGDINVAAVNYNKFGAKNHLQ
jgi:hypothetical protein